VDWSKAKNILIIAFIITNIFLIYNIEKNLFDSGALSTLDEEHIQSVEKILKERGIYLQTEIPKKILKMPVLNVAYENWDKQKIKEMIQKSPKGQIKNLDAQKAYEEAEKFIRENGWLKKDTIYWDTRKEEQGYKVIFKQKYKNGFLEYSYMECVVTPSGITFFDKLWLKPLSTGESKKEIIPATNALLKLMGRVEGMKKPVIIRDIALGYWFDPGYMGFENAESGTAVPAWRFVLENGETIFIDAYKE